MRYNTSLKVGKHLKECGGTTHNMDWDTLDACRRVDKLKTIEATILKMLKQYLNKRDEYSRRHLTMSRKKYPKISKPWNKN